MVIAILVTIPQTLNRPRCPSIYEWIKKTYVYIMGISLTIKNEILVFAGQYITLRIIRVSIVSQAQKDSPRVFSL